MVDPLSSSSAKTWRKKLNKFASKGRRELPKKGGRHFFWEEQERGLFPSAGAPTPFLDREVNVEDLVEGVIPNLRNVRMVCYQSDDDPRVPPGPNRFAAKEMEAAKEKWGGFDFEYWEVSGMGHDLPPGGPIAQLSRLSDAKRDTRPDKIVWQPTLDWKNSF